MKSETKWEADMERRRTRRKKRVEGRRSVGEKRKGDM